MENLTQLIEALLFASGSPKTRTELKDAIGGITQKQFDKAVDELMEKYGKDSGIVLLSFNNKLQFSSNHIYGDRVAEILTPLKEKELSKVLLEVLAIIAYKQPITKSEVEDIKGSSSDYAISILIKTDLIKVVGYKNAVGRPALFATTDEFLKKFQLENIDELPDYEAVLAKLEELGDFYKPQSGLYRERDDLDAPTDNLDVDNEDSRADEILKSVNDDTIVDEFMENDEIPDFLDGEDYNVIE